MKSKLEMKSHLLDLLKDFLLGETGKGLKPRGATVIEVETKPLVEVEPEVEVEDEDEVPAEVEDAAKDAALEKLAEDEVAEPEDDEDNPKRKKTLREFLRSCQ